MTQDKPSARLAALAAAHWQFQSRAIPLYAVLAGEDMADPVLYRESLADHDWRHRRAGELLQRLDAIDPDDLEIQDRATHRLIQHELDSIRSLYAVDNHLRPLLFPTGPAMMTAYLANSTSIGDGPSAELYVDRLATIPAYLADLADCLRAGYGRGIRLPARLLEIAAENTRASVKGPVESLPWVGPLVRSIAADSRPVSRQAARAVALVADEIVPAFERFANVLDGPLTDGARDTISCTSTVGGRDYYRTWVREFTNSEMSPDEVHELGLTEVARLEAAMAEVAGDAGFAGDLAGYRKHLAGNGFIAESAEALRARFQALCKTIDGRIPTFFGRIPRMTYGIESMPEAVAERMPLAYAQPNPGDRSGPGIFWVTSLPEKCPSPIHVPTALHEAWPGHLMHLALVQENEGLPPFRRHGAVRYPAFVEGWAIYCEGLGLDMGLYESPEQHYGRLEMEIWRALRLVVDTGIHWKGWSREKAIDTMAQSMAMSRSSIGDEVDRYICWPGQALAYHVGNLEFRRLREAAEQRLGERFNLRVFHDTLMSAGAVSLPVLRGLVEDWLATEVSR